MHPDCKICHQKLTPKIDEKSKGSYFRCLSCLATVPNSTAVGSPSRYSIQFADQSTDESVIKETYGSGIYIIDYRPTIPETVIGKWVWNVKHDLLTYEEVLRFNSKVFDFSSPELVAQRLKVVLVFS